MNRLIAFLGPSLSLSPREARRLGPCEIWPPARQGDVWRAMKKRPVAIALVDGMFESVPSVWHREILDALAAGIAVFGGGSMGALRAAELWTYGMVGVGSIYERFRRGLLVDDAEVALLHAGPEHGFVPLTVPLVNVRHLARCARKGRVLTVPESKALVGAAERLFYQDRTWPRLLREIGAGWNEATRVRWKRWEATGLPDLKREEARQCIRAAALFAQAGVRLPLALAPALPAMARRRKLSMVSSKAGAASIDGALRRRLLAGWARSTGLVVSPTQAQDSVERWLKSFGRTKDRTKLLQALGLDDSDLLRLGEELALEQLVVSHSSRMLPDGPSMDDGYATDGTDPSRVL